MKLRIVKRTRINGSEAYVIQFKFLSWWRDIKQYHFDCSPRTLFFKSYEDALANVKYYDGTREVDKVVSYH